MIYIYYLEKNNIPFYVGYTNNKTTRLNHHRKKYGIEVDLVELEVVKEIDKKHIETFYIDLFKMWGFKLLNKNKGGGGPINHTQESKEKYKQWRKNKKPNLGKKQSEITKKRKSNALIGKPKPIGFGEIMKQARQGVPKPEGTGYKISKNRDHKKAAEQQKKSILQYDLNGNFIKEWDSIKEAATKTNSNASTISKVCRNIFKKTNKFIWKYK